MIDMIRIRLFSRWLWSLRNNSVSTILQITLPMHLKLMLLSREEERKEKKRTIGKWSNLSFTVLFKQWRRLMHRLRNFFILAWLILRKCPWSSLIAPFGFESRHFILFVHIFICNRSMDGSITASMPVIYHFIYSNNLQSVFILLFSCVVRERIDWTFRQQWCSLLLLLLSLIDFLNFSLFDCFTVWCWSFSFFSSSGINIVFSKRTEKIFFSKEVLVILE